MCVHPRTLSKDDVFLFFAQHSASFVSTNRCSVVVTTGSCSLPSSVIGEKKRSTVLSGHLGAVRQHSNQRSNDLPTQKKKFEELETRTTEIQGTKTTRTR